MTMKVEMMGMRVMALVVALLLAACTKPNPNRCCTDAADCMTQGLPTDSQCDPGLVCRGGQCISEPCTDMSDCDAAAPYCISGLCSELCDEDLQCPGFGQDSTRLFCVSGQCVSCRDDVDCPSSAPVCDAGSCRGCNADSDCASGVCDADSSVCVAESAVLYTTGNGGTSSCTRADPCSLSHAFTLVDATRTAIKLGTGAHTFGNGFAGVKTATIYGPGTIVGDGGPMDGATLRVRAVTWNGSPGCGNSTTNLPISTLELLHVTASVTSNLRVDGVCNLTIRNSELRSIATTPVALVTGAGEPAGFNGATIDRASKIIIERTRLIGGDPGLLVAYQASFDVSNSIFDSQGTNSGWLQVFANSLPTSTVRFSTFHNSLLKCAISAGSGFLTSSNNIYVNGRVGAPMDTATGTYCSHSYDLVKPQSTALVGPGNKLNSDPKFAGPFSGDFHLLVDSLAIDAADPGATEAADYEGTTRPQGAARDMGAFEYH